MSVVSEINILKGNIRNAYTSIQNKGGTIPTNKNTENLSNAIDSISAGGTTTLGPKTITANGVYNASDDELDGYSNVTVDVKTSNAWQRPTDWYDLPTILSNTEDIVRDGVTYYPRIALQLEITNTNIITLQCNSLITFTTSGNKYIVKTSDGQELTTTTSVTITFDTTKDVKTRYVIIYTNNIGSCYTYLSGNTIPVIEIILGKGTWTTPHLGSSASASTNKWLRNFETLDVCEWTHFGYQYCFSNMYSLEHLYLPTITTMTNTANSAINSYALQDVDMPNLKTILMSYFTGPNNALKRLNFPNLETTSAGFGTNYGLMEINVPKLKTINNSYFLQNDFSLETIDLSSIVTGAPNFINHTKLKVLKLPNNFKITGWSLSTCYSLTKECLLDILNKLADVTGETTTYTITFGTNNLAKLTEEELAIGTGKGWTIK